MSIEIEGITRRFGRTAAVDDVSLSLAPGELVALLGPSGSGKTTLLRLIAGLELPQGGRISLDGRDVTTLGARERRVGFVFQHYALFRHMTVFDNVAFGLRSRRGATRPPEREIAERVGRLLELVQLGWTAKRYPAQLSGGQRQRIALARALAIEPSVLLLDEPFGALDAKVRRELRGWIRNLHREVQVTSVFVTHDQEEALEIADRVVVLNQGRIEQVGSPAELCARPANDFVYEFIGQSNWVSWREAAAGRRQLVFERDRELPGRRVRPYELMLLSADDPRAEAVLPIASAVVGTGLVARVTLQPEGAPPLEVELTRYRWLALGLAPGDLVGVALER